MDVLSVLIVALLGAAAATPLVRELALRQGWLDHPDSGRRLHARAVPRLGGVGVVVAFFGALTFLFSADLITPQQRSFAIQILPASAVIFLVGFVDDFWGLRPRHKLLGQVAAAALAFAGGLRLESAGGAHLAGWQSFALGLLWLVFCTNSFNLIDGMDGLASGVGAIAAATFCCAGLLMGDVGMSFAGALLCGSLLGFLIYNFNPASIFMGDCGSLLTGFLLGCFVLRWCGHADESLSFLAPILALAIPILDTCVSIVRRIIRRRPIFSADRDHVHHRLLAQGWSVRRTVLTLCAAAMLAGAIALAQSLAPYPYRAVALGCFALAVWGGIRFLGYHELRIAGHLLFGEATAGLNLDADKADAMSAEECWQVVAEICERSGIRSAELCLDGRRFATAVPEAAAELAGDGDAAESMLALAAALEEADSSGRSVPASPHLQR